MINHLYKILLLKKGQTSHIALNMFLLQPRGKGIK